MAHKRFPEVSHLTAQLWVSEMLNDGLYQIMKNKFTCA